MSVASYGRYSAIIWRHLSHKPGNLSQCHAWRYIMTCCHNVPFHRRSYRYQLNASLFSSTGMSTDSSSSSQTANSENPAEINSDKQHNYSSSLGKESFSSHLRFVIQDSVNVMYQDLRRLYPWLQQNKFKAYLQLNLMDMMEELSDRAKVIPAYDELVKSIDNDLISLDSKDAADILLNLTFLGYDQTSDVFHRLLHHCQCNIQNMDWRALATLSLAAKHLQCRDIPLMSKVLQRSCELLSTLESAEVPPDVNTLADVATICTTNRVFLKEKISKFSHVIELNLKRDRAYLDDLHHLDQYSLLTRKLMFMKFPQIATQILSEVGSAAAAQVDMLTSHHLASVCQSMFVCKYFNAQIVSAMQLRASELLQTDTEISIPDIVNLSFPILLTTGQEVDKFLQIVDKCLTTQTVDRYSLFKLFSPTLSWTTGHFSRYPEVLTLYYKLLADYASNMVMIPGGQAQKVLGLMISYPPKSKDDIDGILHAIAGVLPKLTYTDRHFLSSLAALCVSRPYTKTKEDTLSYLLNNIVSELPLAKLCLWSITVYSKVRFVMQINNAQPRLLNLMENCIQSTILSKVCDTTLDIQEISDAIFTVLSVQGKDPEITKKLFDRLLVFTKELSPYSLELMVKLLSRCSRLKVAYYSKQLCDDLVQYVTEDYRIMSSQTCIQILGYLVSVNYTLEAPSAFKKAVLQAYHALDNKSGLQDKIKIMELLGHLRVYPIEELREVFTLDFMMKLDQHLQTIPWEYARVSEKVMMHLNRQVVLDCPQLDAPWFFGDVKKREKAPFKELSDGYPQLKKNVRSGLAALLGGPHMFSTDVYVPYFYTVDFELILNDQNKVVLSKHSTLMPSTWKRVAILVLGDTCYCFNERRLRGREATRIRHLEMMGFHVVQVPEYEWNNMALNDMSARVDYLRTKIFKSL